MVKMDLGRLERVELRTVWNGEATDFTPWLAQEDNLSLLGEAIGIELELEAQEKDVGPFRADVLCKDTVTGNWVLIENQLERTDHTHLGQLITYAAGLKAVTIVWIAQRFTEEHRAAMDWLNEVTGKGINFFGIEVELWRIGSSPIAPKFSIVSQPNEWTKIGGGGSRVNTAQMTEAKQLQYEFWTGFREHIIENSNLISPRQPLPQHWMDFAVGRTGFLLTASINTRDKKLTAGLSIVSEDAKAYFALLQESRQTIEAEVGTALVWRELPNKKSSYIELSKEGIDPTDKSSWPEYYDWLLARLEQFHKVFSNRVRNLDASDYENDSGIEPVGDRA